MDLPSHPDADDTVGRPAATGANWPVRVLVGLVVMLALVIVLHLTGVVGPAGR